MALLDRIFVAKLNSIKTHTHTHTEEEKKTQKEREIIKWEQLIYFDCP